MYLQIFPNKEDYWVCLIASSQTRCELFTELTTSKTHNTLNTTCTFHWGLTKTRHGVTCDCLWTDLMLCDALIHMAVCHTVHIGFFY